MTLVTNRGEKNSDYVSQVYPTKHLGLDMRDGGFNESKWVKMKMKMKMKKAIVQILR